MATSTLPQNLQEAAVTMIKEHLFLMAAFKVYHMCREHGEGSSKFGGVDGAFVNVWGSMGGGTP